MSAFICLNPFRQMKTIINLKYDKFFCRKQVFFVTLLQQKKYYSIIALIKIHLRDNSLGQIFLGGRL